MYEYGSRAGFWRLWRMFTAAQHAGDGVRRRAPRWRAIPTSSRRCARRAGRSPATASNGSTTRMCRPAQERAASRRGDPHPHAGDRRAPARLVHRPQLGRDPQGRARRRRLPLFVGFLRGRPALLGQRAEGRAPDHSVHARRQRHALHQSAGLRHRRGVLHLSQGCVRPALCRGRARAEDDVGRAALPAGGPAGTRGGAGALSRLHRRARARVGRAPGSTSPSIGIASTARSPRARSRSHDDTARQSRHDHDLARKPQRSRQGELRRRARRYLRARALGGGGRLCDSGRSARSRRCTTR